MIKFENVILPSEEQWRAIILGTRNAMNSWEKSDSCFGKCVNRERKSSCPSMMSCPIADDNNYHIGPNDLDLMKRLAAGGPVHAKYRRMITVYVDITAPLYWWKEFDTYRVGVEKNSCSTMHKIAGKEFTLEDFSHEHLLSEEFMDWAGDDVSCSAVWPSGFADFSDGAMTNIPFMPMDILRLVIKSLNRCREIYLKTDTELKKVRDSFRVGALDMKEKREKMNHLRKKKKQYWWQMIQLLPSSYNQKRTVMCNYEVLAHIWKDRRYHKLDEWAEHKEVMSDIDSTSQAKYAKPYKEHFGFCDWLKTLPYSELITGPRETEKDPDCFVPVEEENA